MTDYLAKIATIGTDPATGKRISLDMYDTGETDWEGRKIMRLKVDTEMGEITIGNVGLLDSGDVRINPRKEDGHGSGSGDPTFVESVNLPIGYNATDDAWIFQPFKTKITPTSGVKDVTTAGTREPLVGSSTIVQKVLIQAKKTNTGDIYFGGSTVAAANGVVLTAGESLSLEANEDEKLDLNEHYLDSEVNGEGVTFSYWS